MPLLSLYRFSYPRVLVYMLQSTEYRARPYLQWFWRTNDFDSVMRRRTLDMTRPARLLLAVLGTGMLLQFVAGAALVVQGLWQGLQGGWQLGLALMLPYPIVWAHLVVVPLVIGRWLFIGPRQRRAIQRSEKIFAAHPGVKLAVVGSYGKTSMKELLTTVLSAGKPDMKVAATPANRNVSTSHAQFAATLGGDEDVLILEYGEGQPGDIARFARRTHPTHAVITGLAPAHLDRYRTLQRAGQDIFSIARFVALEQLYVNASSPAVQGFMEEGMQTYDEHGALGWKVSDVRIGATGTAFKLSKRQKSFEMRSGLLGRHNVGPLAFVAALAMEFGLKPDQVKTGVAATGPFEHRMQPRSMSGALVIDDTYNGNIEGIRAGTALLRELPAKRKWYVTPGLVGQGRLEKAVHHEMGGLIATAKPDIVVLMDNSASGHIMAGLKSAGYEGEIRVEQDPLGFYTNLPHFVAAGDVIMMQNDWTDNYA